MFVAVVDVVATTVAAVDDDDDDVVVVVVVVVDTGKWHRKVMATLVLTLQKKVQLLNLNCLMKIMYLCDF